MENTKIFGIGFQKTGTTSLMHALRKLDYRVCDGCGDPMNPKIAEEVYKICDELVLQYDAFEDFPWPLLYQDLDKKYSNSKFILTTRPVDSWIDSVCSHFGDRYIPMHDWVYGCGYPYGNQSIWIEKYEKHNSEVINYFKDRSEDLLVMPVDGSKSDQELWKDLCSFLGKEVPLDSKFPRSNTKKDRLIYNHLRKFKQKILGKKAIKILGIQLTHDYSNEG